MKQTIRLENLSCQNCVKHVTQHFLSMEGVSDVVVDLEKQTAKSRLISLMVHLIMKRLWQKQSTGFWMWQKLSK